MKDEDCRFLNLDSRYWSLWSTIPHAELGSAATLFTKMFSAGMQPLSLPTFYTTRFHLAATSTTQKRIGPFTMQPIVCVSLHFMGTFSSLCLTFGSHFSCCLLKLHPSFSFRTQHFSDIISLEGLPCCMVTSHHSISMLAIGCLFPSSLFFRDFFHVDSYNYNQIQRWIQNSGIQHSPFLLSAAVQYRILLLGFKDISNTRCNEPTANITVSCCKLKAFCLTQEMWLMCLFLST